MSSSSSCPTRISTTERIARIALGAGLAYGAYNGMFGKPFDRILGVASVVPLTTGIVGHCPAYAVFKSSKCDKPCKTGTCPVGGHAALTATPTRKV